jgi:hypothetical protein
VSTQHEIERLRLRAAYYHREAARSRRRKRLIYCRALASHLEREAIELERVIKIRSSSAPVAGDIPQSPAELSRGDDEQGPAGTITGLRDELETRQDGKSDRPR